MEDEQDDLEWKTLAQWKEEGYRLIDGEKCLKRGVFATALYNDCQVEKEAFDV